MQPAIVRAKRKDPLSSLIKEREERLRILGSVQGIWKKRKPDPVEELKKIRKEWERVLP